MNSIDVENWELLYDQLCLWIMDMDISDSEKDIKLTELAFFDEHYRKGLPMKIKERSDE